jgi:hypothetical protein
MESGGPDSGIFSAESLNTPGWFKQVMGYGNMGLPILGLLGDLFGGGGGAPGPGGPSPPTYTGDPGGLFGSGGYTPTGYSPSGASSQPFDPQIANLGSFSQLAGLLGGLPGTEGFNPSAPGIPTGAGNEYLNSLFGGTADWQADLAALNEASSQGFGDFTGLMTGLQGDFSGQRTDDFNAMVGMLGMDNPLVQMMMDWIGPAPDGGLMSNAQRYGGRVTSRMPGGGGSIADVNLEDLDPAVIAQIEKMTAGRRAELDLASQDRQSEMMSQLFGKNLEQSSVALDKLGRLDYGESQLLDQILKGEGDQILQAMFQDQNVRRDLAIAGMQRQGAMAGAGASQYAADQQLKGMGLNALGGLIGTQFGTLADVFRTTQGAQTEGFGGLLAGLTSGFGDQMASNASFGNTLASMGLGLGELALGGQRNAIDAAQVRNQGNLDLMGLNQQGALAQQQMLMALLGMGNDFDISRMQADAAIRGAELGQPRGASSWDKFLGLAGLAAQTYGAWKGWGQ